MSPVQLDGAEAVSVIHPDLSDDPIRREMLKSTSLVEEIGCKTHERSCFDGHHRNTGPFDMPEGLKWRAEWLPLPNPNGMAGPTADVLQAVVSMELDLAKSPDEHFWIVDFGTELSERRKRLNCMKRHFNMYFANVTAVATRWIEARSQEPIAHRWWLFERSRPEMRTSDLLTCNAISRHAGCRET
jgi:hypothetical protein